MNAPATPPLEQPAGGDPDLATVQVAPRFDLHEHQAWTANGALGVLAALLLIGAGAAGAIQADQTTGSTSTVLGVGGTLLLLAGILLLASLVVVSPGETKVVQLFGRYVGTVRRNGLVLTLPLTTRRRVSVRVRNFETSGLKVNDADGNPIEIAAIVVWRVADTAHASFAVESFTRLRRGAGRGGAAARRDEPPVRRRATRARTTLRGSTEQVSRRARRRGRRSASRSPGSRSSRRASRTSPTPPRSRRRCCSASRPARSSPPARRSWKARCRMVEIALARLEQDDVVTLDEERKAPMVSNLLVVLCGDSRATARRQRRDRSTREPRAMTADEPQQAARGNDARSCCASTRPCTTRSPAGPPTTCARSTRTSRCCCVARSTTQAAHPRAQGRCHAADDPDVQSRAGTLVPVPTSTHLRLRRPRSAGRPATRVTACLAGHAACTPSCEP